MTGRHRIIIYNKKIHYEFELIRNITVIRGDSATGKTTLIEMISQYERDREHSGIKLTCDKRCTVLTGTRWKDNLAMINNSIVFIDEHDRFIVSDEFASMIKNSDNYYVLVTRDNLSNLPYSVSEIYGIHESGKYRDIKKTYNEFYKIYEIDNADIIGRLPEQIIVEDSNSGFEFINSIAKAKSIECISSKGKTGIYSKLLNTQKKLVIVIADGAAFGSEMNRITELIYIGNNVILYLPESFEWLILSSGLIDGNRIQDILKAPEEYADSRQYFSWEQFFTALLISETNGTYLKYSKEKLNDVYLNEKEKNAIIKSMEIIGKILNPTI